MYHPVVVHSLHVYNSSKVFMVGSHIFHGVHQEKRQQLLNEIRTLCEAPQVRGLVEFYGAFYSPDSGQISIALEYMDGGSLADIVRTKKFIPEPILSVITRKVLQVSDTHPFHKVSHTALDFFLVKFWSRTLSLNVFLVTFLMWTCHQRDDVILSTFCKFVNR